jgi:hypothetical protein
MNPSMLAMLLLIPVSAAPAAGEGGSSLKESKAQARAAFASHAQGQRVYKGPPPILPIP